MMALKRKWLAQGSMRRESGEYVGFTDVLLCIAEHTCGMDMKKYFADYENYLKPDFQKARKRDDAVIRHPLRDYPQNLLTIQARRSGKYAPDSYSTAEKSCAEQRAYIDTALQALSPEHRAEAEQARGALIPHESVRHAGRYRLDAPICAGEENGSLRSTNGAESAACPPGSRSSALERQPADRILLLWQGRL